MRKFLEVETKKVVCTYVLGREKLSKHGIVPDSIYDISPHRLPPTFCSALFCKRRTLSVSLMTALFLVPLLTVACLVLPRLLSIILTLKTQLTEQLEHSSVLQEVKSEITSFPYCMSYNLTGSQFCKFSPSFCAKCSPS